MIDQDFYLENIFDIIREYSKNTTRVHIESNLEDPSTNKRKFAKWEIGDESPAMFHYIVYKDHLMNKSRIPMIFGSIIPTADKFYYEPGLNYLLNNWQIIQREFPLVKPHFLIFHYGIDENRISFLEDAYTNLRFFFLIIFILTCHKLQINVKFSSILLVNLMIL